MKKFLIGIICGLIIFNSAQAAPFYDKPSIAVLNFGLSYNTPRNFDAKFMGELFSHFIMETLIESREFSVTDAERLIEQRGISIPRYMTRNDAVNIGKKLGVDYVIYSHEADRGTPIIKFIQRDSKNYTLKTLISIGMVDVYTGEIVTKSKYEWNLETFKSDMPRYTAYSLLRKVAHGFIEPVIDSFSNNWSGDYYGIEDYDYWYEDDYFDDAEFESAEFDDSDFEDVDVEDSNLRGGKF